MRRLALALAILLPATGPLAGCSWLFVQPLSERHQPGDFPDCTDNPIAPVVDTVLTLSNLGSAAYVATEDNVKNKAAAVTVGVLVGAVWLSSAIYGYSKTSACAAAKKDAEGPVRHLRTAPLPPVGYTPAPGGVERAPPATPPSSGSGQQQDDDEPGDRAARRKAAPVEPRPDAPRFGG
jgi:hypothetical protein